MKTFKVGLTLIFIWNIQILYSQVSYKYYEIKDPSGSLSSIFQSIPENSINNPPPLTDETFSVFTNPEKSLSNFSVAQDEKKHYPLSGKSLFFDVQVGPSSLYNKDIRDSYWTNTSHLGYQVDFGFTRRLRFNNLKIFSYGIGLGLSSYNHEISANSVYDTVHGMDLEGVAPQDQLDQRIQYLSISEKTNIMLIDVPVFIEIGNVNAYKIGYYCRLGVKVSFPLYDKFDGMGNYSINGYYPKYNCEITQEIPELGIYRDEQLYSGTKDYDLSSYNIAGLISAGISLPIVEKKWMIRLGANYIHGFTDISADGNVTDNMLQKDINHIMENDQAPTKTRSLGFEIGFQFIIDPNY